MRNVRKSEEGISVVSFQPEETLTIRSGNKKILRLEVSKKKDGSFYLYSEIQDKSDEKTKHIMINEADSKAIKDFLRRYFR